jgi:hypothetical protein
MTLPSDRKVPRIHMHMAVLGRGWVKVMKEGGAATGARQIIGVMFSVPFALRVLTDDGVARPPAVLLAQAFQHNTMAAAKHRGGNSRGGPTAEVRHAYA